MSVSDSSMSRLHNVTSLLLSCLTNSTKTKLRINILPPVCVCVSEREREKEQLDAAATQNRSLLIKRPIKQTLEALHFNQFTNRYIFNIHKERIIDFPKTNWLQHLKTKYNLSCFRRLKALFGSIDQRQSRKAFIWKSIFNIF